MKIGLLGGSFNPVHLGHLALAKTAMQKIPLDRVWFIPTGNHPLKEQKELLPLQKRIKLIQTTIKDYAKFEISYLDSYEHKPNFTDELIKKIYEFYPDDTFYFLAGEDIVEELPNWHNFEWLVQNVNFVIFTRPGSDKEVWNKLYYCKDFKFLEMSPVHISSSEIRKRIRAHQKVKDMLPASIKEQAISYYEEYFKKNSSPD